MTVKLVDIAKHVGLSVSTVSRVVNGKDRVSAKTRQRVLDAIKELNYQPNAIARSLRSRSSMTIGIVVPDLSNNFFTLLTKGAGMIAKQDDYLVMLCNSEYDEQMEQEFVRLLMQKQVDGMILATVCKDPDYFRELINMDIPVVFVDNLPKVDANYDFVTIDNSKSSYVLTKHLLDLGYKDVAILTGSLHETSAVERLTGWKRAMEQYGIPVNEDFVGIGDFRLASGYALMNSMLELERRPKALLASNNFMAYGAIKAALQKGLRVPDDLSVVCFDAVDHTGLIDIKIPSMVQPAEKIGEIAATTIIKKIHGKDYRVYDNVILEPVFNTAGLLQNVPKVSG